MADSLERDTVSREILELCALRGVTLAAACKASGLKYSTLHAQIHNRRPIPFETVSALGQFFDVPLERFSSFRPNVTISSSEGQTILHQRARAAYEAALQEQHMAMIRAGYGVGTDEVLDWLRAQSGRLTDFDTLREHVDLFHPVKSGDRIFRPLRVGRLSLASRAFRAEDEEHFIRLVKDSFSQDLMNRVLSAHVEASVRPYVVSDETIDINVAGARIRGAYRRIIAPVTDAQGNRFTLVHSKRI